MICARSSSVSQLLKPTFERQIFLLGIATTFLCLSRMKFVALWTLPRHFKTCNISLMHQIEIIIWDVQKQKEKKTKSGVGTNMN